MRVGSQRMIPNYLRIFGIIARFLVFYLLLYIVFSLQPIDMCVRRGWKLLLQPVEIFVLCELVSPFIINIPLLYSLFYV